jgi:hypothetical protein
LYNILILYPHETGKANKNVSDWNLQQILGKQTFVWHFAY